MAGYGVDVYENNLASGNLGLNMTNGVRDGAGHEDERDHIYGETGNTTTIGHFWDPDPFSFSTGSYIFDPLNQSLLDGGAIFQGLTPNGWQKAQAYWSRALAEYAFQNFEVKTGAYHYLGHVVHHMGDNTIPTHAHVTSHGPGNRDSFENWMSNKYHAGFPLNAGGDFRFEYLPSPWNHLLLQSELNALTTDHQPKLGRIDPLQYADLDFNIPEVEGVERPDEKLLWLLYTTNQIAEFFAADRDDGQSVDPTGWVVSDLAKMSAAGLRPRTEEQIDAADSADGTGNNPDVGGVLSQIREYSYLRGIRAIGGLYNLFEQTLVRKPILTIEIHKAAVKLPNGTCNDGLIEDRCDFYSRVNFSSVTSDRPIVPLLAISGQNEGEELSDKDTINPDFWRWGHAVENTGFALIQLQIVDEEDFPYPEDTPVRIIPLYSDDSNGGKALNLEVDLEKCLRGEAGALKVKNPFFGLPDPSTSSQISSDRCGQSITTRVTGEEDENDGIAAVTFTVEVAEFAPPVITCASADGAWHASDASILCTAVDDGIGLENPNDASFLLTTNTSPGSETDNAATNSRNICDALGNCASAGPVYGNKVDKKAPVIGIAQPASTQYVHSATLVLDYSVTDGGSGVDIVSPTLDGNTTIAGNGLQSGQAIDLLTSLSLGDHTFTINAVDSVNNASQPESVTFSIIVTPQSIIGAVNQLFDSGAIHRTAVKPLLAKLMNAQKKWDRSQCKPAVNLYGAFINHVQAQNGKKITPAAAEILIADAQYLIAHCLD